MPWLSIFAFCLNKGEKMAREWNDTLTALVAHSAFPVRCTPWYLRLLLVSGLRSGARLLPALRVRKAEMIEIFIRLYQIGLDQILSATSHSRRRKERSDHRRFIMHILHAPTTLQPTNSPKPKATHSAHMPCPVETLPFTGTACQLCHWSDQCCTAWNSSGC